jgi:hypothetical protein
MWNALKKGLVGLFGSKKFLAALLSAIGWAVGKFGVDLDADELYPLVAPLWAYVLAQMGADWGKAAAEITAGNVETSPAEEPEEPKPE